MISYFPDRVNEHAARLTAAGVALVTGLSLALGWTWPLAVVALGFVARVLFGPRLSVLSQLSSALALRLAAPKLVTGAPKRFAQGIGAAMMAAAVASDLAGAPRLGLSLAAAVAACAFLEAAFAFCVGCRIYGLLQRRGWIAADACPECAGGQCPVPAPGAR